MSEKYAAWLLSLQQRDETLMLLALIAVSLVGAWCAVDWLPVRVRPVLRRVYLLAGVPLYLLTLAAVLFQ